MLRVVTLLLFCTWFPASAISGQCTEQDDIKVLDDLFTREEAWHLLHRSAHQRQYLSGEADFDGAAEAGTVSDLDLHEPLVKQLANRLQPHVLQMAAARFGSRPNLYRAYINRFTSADHPRAHRDARVGAEHVTCLVYANGAWQRDWGGETVFYSEDHEIRRAVRPRPGRVVLFAGGVMHSARPPLPDAGTQR